MKIKEAKLRNFSEAYYRDKDIISKKISISTCFDYEIPLEEQMKHVAEAGFTHISLGSNLDNSRLFDSEMAQS